MKPELNLRVLSLLMQAPFIVNKSPPSLSFRRLLHHQMVRGFVMLQRSLTSTAQPGRQSCSEPHMEKRLSDDTKVSNLYAGCVVNAALSDTAITI